MRLADRIRELAVDPACPLRADFARLAAASSKAAHFEFDPVAGQAAGAMTTSRLGQIIEARRFARVPFRAIWIEYLGASDRYIPACSPMSRAAPVQTTRTGILVSVDETFQRGAAQWIWSIPGDDMPLALPFVVQFDWSASPTRFPTLLKECAAIANVDWSANVLSRARAMHGADLGGVSESKVIAEAHRYGIVPSSVFSDTWENICGVGGEAIASALELAMTQLPGEFDFLEGLMICLSARNVFRTREPEDLQRLNKARARRGRLPLISFSSVQLNLSRVASRKLDGAGEGGMRAHLVRGHFKVRKSGIYWWSPFLRGDAERGIVARDSYQVVDA